MRCLSILIQNPCEFTHHELLGQALLFCPKFIRGAREYLGLLNLIYETRYIIRVKTVNVR